MVQSTHRERNQKPNNKTTQFKIAMDGQHHLAACPTESDDNKTSLPLPSSSQLSTSHLATTTTLPALVPSTITSINLISYKMVTSSENPAEEATEEGHKADEIPFSTFTCFGRLPLELRRKIIKEACKHPRILNVLANSYSLTGIPSSIVNLAILYASSETRATALEVLKSVFYLHIKAQYNHGGPGAFSKSKDMFGKVLMSSKDILYFNSNCTEGNFEAANATLTFRNGRACLDVTSIAFNTTVLKDTQYGAYKWLKVLAWTCPAMKFILVDRLAPPLDNFLPDTMQAADQQEDSEGHTQVSHSQSPRLPEVQPGGPLEMIDLDEGTYTALDDEMKDAIAKLANRPSDLTIWGVLGFNVPITKKADFKIPKFKRTGLTRGGVRI
ncbi:hypothetical protein DL98DRAFT_614386 [Cadophora sp. DSE1049]|nr:hypothetical protein DL98DRAFT_614386 [Cadophora sp. DSE1049]